MDPGALKEVLRELGDLLPQLPDGLAALAAEADALALETAAFLDRMQARQVEAMEVAARVEAAIGALRATAAAQVASLAERPAAAEVEGPALAFDTEIAAPVAEQLRREDAARAELAAGIARIGDEHAASLEELVTVVEERAQGAAEHVGAAAEQALMGASTLQATVAAVRRALGEQAERLGAALEAESARAARDLDELARDLEGLEATLTAALQGTGDLIHADAERVHAETMRRLDALAAHLDQALQDAGESLRRLQTFLHTAEREATDARQALDPRVAELESRLGPLRQAVESVRDAAASVGIGF